MYFDRSIDPELARAIGPSGPLSWLVDHLRSDDAAACHAHVQFRRDRDGRRRGSVQLYWGRTSPLEFRLQSRGRVRLHADKTYRRLSAALFSEPVAIDRLRALEAEFLAHLERVSRLLDDSPPRRQAFLKREAVTHAGLMRRYGHDWRAGDPLLAIDSEARIGFTGDGQRPGTDERRSDDADTRAQLQLDDSEAMPWKLDTLAVLPSGDLALVEVKDIDGSIDRAIVQIAAHHVRYSRLMAQSPLREALQRMIDQKVAAGLILRQCPGLAPAPRIVPCIAAPDRSNDWPASWRAALDKSDPNLRAVAADLQFIRLDTGGRILDLRT